MCPRFIAFDRFLRARIHTGDVPVFVFTVLARPSDTLPPCRGHTLSQERISRSEELIFSPISSDGIDERFEANVEVRIGPHLSSLAEFSSDDILVLDSSVPLQYYHDISIMYLNGTVTGFGGMRRLTSDPETGTDVVGLSSSVVCLGKENLPIVMY